jgi:hypothetical protein
LFSTALSLVFVPAMFMMMDDLGALIWRFASRLIVSTGDAEQLPAGRGDHRPPPTPPAAISSPAAE